MRYLVTVLLLISSSLGEGKVKSEIYWGMGTTETCIIDNTSTSHCKLSIAINDNTVVHQCFIKQLNNVQEVPCD